MSQQQTFIADIAIYTGTDFTQTFVLEDVQSNALKDLSGYTGCSSMRRYESSSVAASFTVDFSTDRTDGKVILTMLESTTSTLKPGKYFYDLVLQDSSGEKTRVVEGTVTVKRAVTR